MSLPTLEQIIDRWGATARPASFYIKMEEGDKGSVRHAGGDWYAHTGVQGNDPVIQLIATWAPVIATVTVSDCTWDRREMAVRGTCPANRSREQHPRCSGAAEKDIALSFLLKMRICMLMRGAGNRFPHLWSSNREVRDESQSGNYGCKIRWGSFLLHLMRGTHHSKKVCHHPWRKCYTHIAFLAKNKMR